MVRADPFFRSLVIAVRVSGGHLCEAEAPTEPAGETAVRCVAIRFSFKGELRILSRYAFRMTSRLVIAKPCKRLWQSVFLLRGITDSFTLRVQNDIPFSHCEAVQTAVAIRFSFKGELRILSRYAFRMTSRLVIANT